MFSNERYLTREVADRVPVEIQILMWNLVEEIEGEKDYLQVFEVIKDVMDKFKEVFFNMSTSQQRKQLIHLIVSQITINEKREVDSIEIQINDDVITYLMKDELPKLNGNSSFLHLLGMNHINLKIAI